MDLADEQRYDAHVEQCRRRRAAELRVGGTTAADAFASAALSASRSRCADELADVDERFFGRLDLADEGGSLYLGRTRITGERPAHVPVELAEAGLLVMNWQAQAAKPFYTAQRGGPHRLAGRRRYERSGGDVVSFSEELLCPVPHPRDPEEAGAATSDATDVAGRDLLLADLGRGRDEHMRDIVATIQADQYALMERPANSLLAIQGCPGSGKTAVALHRLSLLGYRDETVRRGGMLLVGPNAGFIHYVSQVLPGLGDQDVTHRAFEQLAQVRVTKHDEDELAAVKGSAVMAEVLRRAVRARLRPLQAPLALKLASTELVLGPAGTLRAYREACAVQGSVRAVRARILTVLADELAARYVESVGGPDRLRFAPVRDPDAALREHPAVLRAVDRMVPTAGADVVLRELCGSIADLAVAAEDLLGDRAVLLLHEDAAGGWSRGDLALLDELQALLEGEFETWGHVAVDEAQDLTPMDLRMVGRRAAAGAGVTLLGDLAQSTGPVTHQDWPTLTEHLALPRAVEVAELQHGYRVPAEVMAYADALLPRAGVLVSPSTSVRSVPDSLVVAEVPGHAMTTRTLNFAHEGLLAGQRVAVLSPTLWRARLAPEQRAWAQSSGVTLASPLDVKGQEFDRVVVVDPQALEDEVGVRGLYVALTRCTQQTFVVSEELADSAAGRSQVGPLLEA